MQSKANSIGRNVSFLGRLSYLVKLTFLHATRKPKKPEECFSQCQEISAPYSSITNRNAADARVLEIGFGARPHRSYAMQLLFKTVVGVDLDHPIFSLKDYLPAVRVNGFFRATKGVVRAVLFDRGEWKKFHEGLYDIDNNYDRGKTKLCVSNVASEKFWAENPEPYDLIYSTDVFEHSINMIWWRRQSE